MILLGVAAVGVVVVGVVAALAIYGFRNYIAQAKSAEGRASAMLLARGIASCAASSGGLPASSKPVPSSLAFVSGQKYMSAPDDWSSDPAYSCAGFSMSSPQYFQYQWVRSSPESGTVMALADLDGDASAELHFRVEVACAGASCNVGPLQER